MTSPQEKTTTPSAETVDISMSWQAAVNICLLALECGTAKGKKMAREELLRMARVLDALCPGGETK